MDVYYAHPELQTKEEKEDGDFVPKLDRLFPPQFCAFMRADKPPNVEASPEALTRAAFEQRPPALGLTKSLVAEAREFVEHVSVHPVEERYRVSHLRSIMLRKLIPCTGSRTTMACLEVLEKELDCGVPSPVPEWYKYSTTTMGLRKIGYSQCGNRGCFETEDLLRRFFKCSQCSTSIYCSKACQVDDWKVRHKKVCKETAKFHGKEKKMGKILQLLSDSSLTGQSVPLNAEGSFDRLALGEHLNNPAVRERRGQLKKEKNRAPYDPPVKVRGGCGE